MKVLRRLLLPALVAAPAAEVSTGLAIFGPGGFTRFALVLLAGLAGGGLFATLVGGGDPRAALFGLAPGGITAAVWLMFNADMLADRPERMA